ncbi:MAG: thiamine phosphate synthase [Planctomycetota bacterium]
MNTPRRIIDANANRAREALRVLEEAARFLAEDKPLSHEIKQMRHAFTQAIAPLDDLLIDRDTPGDVGTQLTTEAENARANAKDVVMAAGSRLAEALRVIEEYSKIDAVNSEMQQQLVRTCERLRYQSYDIAKRLVLALGFGDRPQWRLCLLLTRSLCKTPWRSVLQHAVENGVDCVQVREKDMDSGPLLTHIREVIGLVNGRAAVIVNDRPDLTRLSGAQGVHLGQSDLSPQQARAIVGASAIIGVSTANLEQAKRAKADGADYCGVGPMFPTTTKHKPDLVGPAYLREYVAWNGLPHLAIGGISPTNIDELVQAGCRGVAVSSVLCAADSPGEVAGQLLTALSPSETYEQAKA